MSLPGSENQHVHRDTPMRQSVETSWTPPFQFVVLLPLVPLTEENGAARGELIIDFLGSVQNRIIKHHALNS